MQDGNQRYVPIITEVDTGAKASTINRATYKEHFGSVKLKPIHGSCTNYDGSKIDGIHGYITTRMLFRGRSHRGTLYVVKDDIPAVLGRTFLKPLKIQIDCVAGSIHKIQANRTPKDSKDTFKEFPNLTSERLGTHPRTPNHRLSGDAVPKAANL